MNAPRQAEAAYQSEHPPFATRQPEEASSPEWPAIDTLALWRLLGALSPALTPPERRVIIVGSATRGVGALANLCVALGDALGEPYTGIADPLELYARLMPELEAGRWARLRIEPMSGQDSAALAMQDGVRGSAFRFALLNLHSFALLEPTAASARVPLDGHGFDFWSQRVRLLGRLLGGVATGNDSRQRGRISPNRDPTR